MMAEQWYGVFAPAATPKPVIATLNTTIVKKDGEDVTGRILEESDKSVVLLVNPLTGDRAEVQKSDIQKRQASQISPMPTGLVNGLTKEEILDLVAYLESAGKMNAANFKQ